MTRKIAHVLMAVLVLLVTLPAKADQSYVPPAGIGLSDPNTFTANQTNTGQWLGRSAANYTTPAFSPATAALFGWGYQSSTADGYWNDGAGTTVFTFGTLATARGINVIGTTNGYHFTTAAGTNPRSGISEVAAGVIKADNGSGAGSGWIQNASGRARLSGDYTNATTTFSNTALSYTLTTGRAYNFKVIFFISDSLAADGAKLDFNGGTAAMTTFRAHCTLFDTALLASQQQTTLAGVFNAATVTGSAYFECYGYALPSGSGTFIPRLAQNAHTTGTLTAFAGSFGWVEDMP